MRSLLLAIALVLPTMASAQDAAKPEADAAAEKPAETPAKKAPKTEFKINGLYTFWGLTQQNFLFGLEDAEKNEHPLDDTQYTVQMLRTNVAATRGNVGVVMRMDLGQGWWGANNSPNIASSSSFDPGDPSGDPAPSVTNSTDYNANKLFGNKDTNYGVHLDLAYGWTDIELGNTVIHVQAGRQYYGVGHKLVLDYDYDGITASIRPSDDVDVKLMWAKVSEGIGSFKTPSGLLMNDTGDNADADLLGVDANFKLGDNHKLETYALYYMDQSDSEAASFLPNGYGYARARWQPNMSSVLAVGLAADGKLELADGLSYKFEGSFLSGKDEIDNADHQGGLLDINNGSLSGYNVYLDLKQHVAAGKGMDIGVLAGMGSGDPDKTKGAGNINKIQTMGFFPLTNVWEDSVMPDIEGISPQGLGSPVSRGYREFENTIALQGNYAINLAKPLRIQTSYTYLMASQGITGFDETGTPTGKAATDLGQEVDANLIVKLKGPVVLKTLGGVFLPGDAAANLINGNTKYKDAAWEIKQVGVVKF